MGRIISHILISLLMCLFMGCAQSDIDAPQPLKGSLTVQFSAVPATRATTPGDGDIYKGGGMEDLTLILVNQMEVISEIQQITNITGDEQRVKQVTFMGLEVGNYMLYAYANTERALLSEARNLISSLRVGDKFDSARYNALFTSLSGRTTPVMNDINPMLLTASKAISVAVENSSVSIDMLRPIVWFEVKLFNHSNHPMTVSDVSFSKFNPSTSYILPKDGVIPSTVTYRDLPTYATYSGGTDVVVEEDSESTIYAATLFENRASSYTISLTSKVSSIGFTDMVSIASTSDGYMLRNRSTGKYLVDNGSGQMVLMDFNNIANINNAQWRFSKTSTGYMTNVGTGKRYYRSTTSATTGSNLSFAMSSGYLRISYGSGRNTSYLFDDNGTPNFSTSATGDVRDWQIRKREVVESSASITNSLIKVIDRNTAAVTPMTEQLRNQHIEIVINAYYNDASGKFNFVVLPWTEKNEEVEFN